MSTADSCLMAASGNIATDLFGLEKKNHSMGYQMRFSQLITLVVGALAILLALRMQNVLELMLYSYAFMVSGLFIPVLGLLFLRKPPQNAAFWSMVLGGGITLVLTAFYRQLPWGLDPIFYGICAGGIVFVLVRRWAG